MEKLCPSKSWGFRLLISCMLLGNFVQAYAQARKVIIDPSDKHQKIEYFTASDAWSANFVGRHWDERQKGQIAEWLFSQKHDTSGHPAGIGLSLWRVNLGGGTLEQEGADIKPIQRRAESFLSADGMSYDWGKCAGQQYFMQRAVDHGCNNFLLFANSPPVQYTKNAKGWSSSENEANIKLDCYGKYAGYMADVASYFSRQKGWHVSYISPINEPQVKWVTPRQEGTPWGNSEMKRLYTALDSAISGKGLNHVKIFVGESAGWDYLYASSSDISKRFSESEAPGRQIANFFDVQSPHYLGDLAHAPRLISGHSYHSHVTNKKLRETRLRVKVEAEKYGVSIHQSEWCMLPRLRPPMDGFSDDWEPENYAGMQPALLLGRLVYGDFVYAGAKAWGYWKGMEVNGDHALVSLFPTAGDIMKGGVIRANKILWALGNYSFFVRPGYDLIGLQGADDLDGLVASAYQSPDESRIVVVFVNSSFETETVSIALPPEWDSKKGAVSAYRTDERVDLAKVMSVEGSSWNNECEIPPRSLLTVVLDF